MFCLLRPDFAEDVFLVLFPHIHVVLRNLLHEVNIFHSKNYFSMIKIVSGMNSSKRKKINTSFITSCYNLCFHHNSWMKHAKHLHIITPYLYSFTIPGDIIRTNLDTDIVGKNQTLMGNKSYPPLIKENTNIKKSYSYT